MTSKEPKFFTANTTALRAAVDSTGESISKIANTGGTSADTLNKALGGGRIMRSKANAICNGLNAYKCNPLASREALFPHAE
jgi:hypothetical protein